MAAAFEWIARAPRRGARAGGARPRDGRPRLVARARVRRARAGDRRGLAARGPGGSLTAPLRVAVVADYREEGWHSMDLVAEMLGRWIPGAGGGDVRAEVLRPPFHRRLSWNGNAPSVRDRVINRYWDYPRWLRCQVARFDVFHVADHSYAHLVHVLPAQRTVVSCHDVDAFLPFASGEDRRKSQLPIFLSRRSFTGLQRAAAILCISESTRSALNTLPGIDAARSRVVPLGVDSSFTPAAERDCGSCRQRAAGTVRRGRGSAARRQHDRSQADRHPAARVRRGARRAAVRAARARGRAADRGPGRARARPRDRRRNRAAAVSGRRNAGGRVSTRRADAAHLGA